MDKLEHDPRTKQQIKDALYQFLYAPVQKQFKARLDTLIERNTIIGGFSHRHFVYKGELYNGDTTHPLLRKNRLLPALRVPMDEYLADLTKLNTEELPYVLGFINQVLNSSCDLGDYQRLLPAAVHAPLNSLIATCPCTARSLNEEKIQQLVSRNEEPINLMKQRLVINLLI